MIHYVPFHDARKWQREGLRTRDAHLCQRLLQRWGSAEIVVLNRPTCVAEALKLAWRWRTAGMALQTRHRCQLTVTPGGYRAVDSLLLEAGFSGWSFHAWLARAYASNRYRAALTDLLGASVSQGTLWLCHPFAAGLLRSERRALVVADLFDNFVTHPDLGARACRSAEDGYRVIASRAYRITVNSLALQSFLWERFRREAELVPNGVDRELFANANPMNLDGAEPPIIGYAGKVGRRLDIDILVALSSALAKGTVLIAGPILNRRWARPALRLPRVRYVGDLHYRDLPSFVAACHVCIVPHRVGPGENLGDPTKIYEYLAAGKPVVTTAIEGTGAFAGRVTIARTRETFVEATLAAARGEAVPRGGVQDDETWEARARAICSYFGLSW